MTFSETKTPLAQEDALPQDPEAILRKIDHVIAIMGQLCSLIKRENKALKQHKFDEVERLHEPKVKLTAAYAEGFRFITKNENVLRTLQSLKQNEIRAIGTDLKNAMNDNEILLQAGIHATRKLVQTIVDSAAAEENNKKGRYSASGAMGDGKKGTTPLSINTVL